MPEINNKMDLQSVVHEMSFKNESTEPTIQRDIPKMYGIKKSAEIFGISQNYARQLALSGAVKAVRVGRGKILINAESMADFFNNSYINADEPTTNGDIKPISIENFTDSFGE